MKVIGLGLLLLSLASTTQGQNTSAQQPEPRVKLNLGGSGDPHSISEGEARELIKWFGETVDMPLQVTPSDNSPVSIQQAIIRAAKREQPADITQEAGAPINDYAMQARITIHNDSDEKVEAVGIEFKNIEGAHTFFVYTIKLALPKHASRDLGIRLMTVSGDPGHLAVRVVGVRFRTRTSGEQCPPRRAR